MSTMFRRQERKGRIPLGCDQRGHHPEAAHAEISWDDDPNTAPDDWRSVIAWWLPVMVPFLGVISLAAAAIYWPWS